MNAATITGVTAKQARTAYRDYRRAWKERHGPDDEALMLCYRAIARGQTVLDLRQTILDAGFHEDGLPKLAIVHAAAKRCNVTHHWSELVYSDEKPDRRNAMEHRRIVFRGMPQGPEGHRYETGRADVPIIPPKLRPVEALETYSILWEADWRRAPADPLLLKRLTTIFYAVIAQWDLTPLEQAVMNGRIGA